MARRASPSPKIRSRSTSCSSCASAPAGRLLFSTTTRADSWRTSPKGSCRSTPLLPAGVPLRHRNIIAGVGNAVTGGYFEEYEDHYAYLPMAWVGDLVFTVGAGTLLRFTTHIPERQETVLRDIREVAPTIYLAAPRAWDNMLTRIQIGMADSTPFKRRLYEYFMPRAIERERKRLAGKSAGAAERLSAYLGEL